MTNTSTDAETSQINSSSNSISGPSGPVHRRINKFEGTGPAGRVSRSDMRNWSNRLHRTQPRDLFKHTKIPYKTIFISILFFIIGSIFMFLGIEDYLEVGGFSSGDRPGQEPYEKLILGSILFIPGSFHTFIALMACLNKEGYSYHDVSSFERENFWDDDI